MQHSDDFTLLVRVNRRMGNKTQNTIFHLGSLAILFFLSLMSEAVEDLRNGQPVPCN